MAHDRDHDAVAAELWSPQAEGAGVKPITDPALQVQSRELNPAANAVRAADPVFVAALTSGLHFGFRPPMSRLRPRPVSAVINA